jgi:signal transduction histidine kinase
MFVKIKLFKKGLLILILILSIIPVCFASGGNKVPDSLRKTRETALYQRKPDPANQEENTRLKTEKEKDQTIINDQRASLSIGTFAVIIICVGLVIVEQLYRQVKTKNKLIQEQNRKLENSNKVKDTIFSIISHDLRNPISQVIGLLDLWQEGDITTGEIEALLPAFKVSSLNTLELVDNLLIWAKNQLLNFNYYPVSFKVSKAVDGVINKLRPAITQKSLSVVNEISPSISVFADEEMITIALRNLVSNAIKFTPEKGSIRLTGTMKDGFATIVVVDNGIGIKAAYHEEIFNAPADLKASKGKSPGLGLKICKDFMALNHGHIWVESGPDEGSKFYISIPMDAQAAKQEPEVVLA